MNKLQKWMLDIVVFASEEAVLDNNKRHPMCRCEIKPIYMIRRAYTVRKTTWATLTRKDYEYDHVVENILDGSWLLENGEVKYGSKQEIKAKVDFLNSLRVNPTLLKEENA